GLAAMQEDVKRVAGALRFRRPAAYMKESRRLARGPTPRCSAVRSEEADMAEAPAYRTIESGPADSNQAPSAGYGPGAGRPVRKAATRITTVAVTSVLLLVGANLVSRLDWASQAQIRSKPAGFADVVEKVKPAVVSVRVKIDAGKRTKESS